MPLKGNNANNDTITPYLLVELFLFMKNEAVNSIENLHNGERESESEIKESCICNGHCKVHLFHICRVMFGCCCGEFTRRVLRCIVYLNFFLLSFSMRKNCKNLKEEAQRKTE